MQAPVCIQAPTILPVTLSEMKLHLRIEPEQINEDELVTSLLEAATQHLDGRNGILLGRCLEEQVWRQAFPVSGASVSLALAPVIEIQDAFYINSNGQCIALLPEEYSLGTDGSGTSYVVIKNNAAQGKAVIIDYKAGYANTTETSPKSTVPAPIKTAIKLLVGAWYENREETAIGVSVSSLPVSIGINALLTPFKRRVLF